MRTLPWLFAALTLALPAQAQHHAHRDSAATRPAALVIDGAAERTLRLDPAELAAAPRQTVRATDHGSTRTSVWSGVSLAELLARAGVPAGERLRGPALTTYVVVEAADGYRAVFSLAELDPALGGRRVLVADARDGKPLAGAEGPLRLVSPDDERHSRWVRQIVRVTVRRG